MQILLTVAYDGTHYAGWQRQTNGLAVQQVLEEALGKMLEATVKKKQTKYVCLEPPPLAKESVVVRAASRTDAGVHAIGQRAVFEGGDLRIPMDKLPVVLNGLLPADIAVTAAEAVPVDFNPRYHTRYKTYRYQYYNALHPNPLLCRYAAFVPQRLDVAAMAAAAPLFVGRRDFSALRNASPEWGTDTGAGTNMDLSIEAGIVQKCTRSAVREIFACGLEIQGPLLTLTVTGDGFLYNMVRILAGTVLYAGLGKITPDEVLAILDAKDRAGAGKTMPPEGLTLMEVVY